MTSGSLTALFWDVGGVLLSNGWDTQARRRAAEQFHLDWEGFERRHQEIVKGFERGQRSLDDYLAAVVFTTPRQFSRDDFRTFIFEQSVSNDEVMELAQKIARQKRYLMATLNNESFELNQYRIQRFGLKNIFQVFFSSSFLGVEKPDSEIYRRALLITQKSPEECVFIDDRKTNVDTARKMGMQTIQFDNASNLTEQLRLFGVRL